MQPVFDRKYAPVGLFYSAVPGSIAEDQQRPKRLRVILYFFIFSTVFDFFTFPLIGENNNLSKLLGLLLTSLFFISRAHRTNWFERRIRYYFIFLIVIIMEEGIRWASLPSYMAAVSMRYFFSYVQIMIMFFIIRDITMDPRAYQGVLTVYFFSYFAIALVTLSGLYGVTTVSVSGRVGFMGANVNGLSFLYGLIAISLFSLVLNRWPQIGKREMWLSVACLILVAALAKTGSRGGSVTLAAGAMVATVVQFRIRRLPAYLLFVPLILGGIVYLLMSSDVLMNRVNATLYHDDTGSRLELAEAAIKLYERKPVIGWGASYVFPLGRMVGKRAMSAHNTYLQMLLSFGVIGLSFFLLCIVMTLWDGWRNRQLLWGGICFTILVMTMVFGIVGHLGYSKHFWVIIALATNAKIIGEGLTERTSAPAAKNE